MNIKYLFNRTFDLSIVLIGISLIVFSMIRLIPGDAVAIMLGANTEITEEAMNELRARLGLDKSIIEQYFIWIKNMLMGDFGTSIWTGRPVSLPISLSMFFSKAPPPVKVSPISTKSADNSGGVFSNASLIPAKICCNIGFKASDVSSSFKLISLGVPVLISLPLTC